MPKQCETEKVTIRHSEQLEVWNLFIQPKMRARGKQKNRQILTAVLSLLPIVSVSVFL